MGSTSNIYVHATEIEDYSFISVIAAFELKPVFITGCTLTAIFYAPTIYTVNRLRWNDDQHDRNGDTTWRKTIALLATLSSIEASISLFLLAIFDTVQTHSQHRILLVSTFGGLGLSAVLTAVAWSDQLKLQWPDTKLQTWCVSHLCIERITEVGQELGQHHFRGLHVGFWYKLHCAVVHEVDENSRISGVDDHLCWRTLVIHVLWTSQSRVSTIYISCKTQPKMQ